MGMVGAPVLLATGEAAVISKQERMGDHVIFTVGLAGKVGQLVYRDEFEILPPSEAEAHGLKIVRRPRAVAGQPIHCTGNGTIPHRPWITVWFSVSVARTLVAFCPACGTYYLGNEEGGR